MTDNEIQLRSDFDVEVVQVMASDEMVVKAARVSTQGGAAGGRSAEADAGLIRYLVKNKHGSPFEHNLFTWMVSAPIFVFREMVRHRIGVSWSEESGRYRELRPVFYQPGYHRPLVQIGKPGYYEFVSGTPVHQTSVEMASLLAYHAAWAGYRKMLGDGVAREVARKVLPVGIYSTAFVTMNSRSLMNFLSLRTKHEGSTFPSYPQWEIEQVASAMEAAFETNMPITWEAFRANGSVAP